MSEKFHWASPEGVEIVLPKMADLPSGLVRRNRKLEEVDFMFTIVEELCDEEMLGRLDSLKLTQLQDCFEAWQNDAEVTLGESAGSST